MQLNETINEFITNNKEEIEVFQQAFISSLASLVYCEYLRNMKTKQSPTIMILVPQIKAVSELLSLGGKNMELISEVLIECVSGHDLIKKFKEDNTTSILKDENIEIMKMVLDKYIMKNAYIRIPETIQLKFDLANPTQQSVREDRDLDLFNREQFSEDQIKYIIDETVLQWIVMNPNIHKNTEWPDQCTSIQMCDHEILGVNHESAICPIAFNKDIFENKGVFPLLSLITNVRYKQVDWSIDPIVKGSGHIPVSYMITSNPFNAVTLMTI